MTLETLRDAQRDVTRDRIVEAVRQMLVEANPGALSMVAVAERSGVSRRTVYRHFPTKEELVAAVAEDNDERVRGQIGGRQVALQDPESFLLDLWPDLARNLDATIVTNATPAGREVRRRRIAERRAVVGEGIRSLGIDPTSEEGQRLLTLFVLLTSSSALAEMTDIQGLAPKDAARIAGWALQLIMDHARGMQ
jgi:AcrR family transcriptional regulator